MKHWLTGMLLIFASAGSALVQGATDFTVTLSGDPIYYGQGTFSLEGNSLSYFLRTDPFGFDRAEIHGPADPNQTAPVVYNLHIDGCFAPGGGSLGHCTFLGTLSISDAQAVDLENGLWYINSYLNGNPGRFIRGQITAVPEPSTWVLLVVGAGAGWLVCRGKPA